MNTRKVLKYVRIVTYIVIGIMLLVLKFLDNIRWTCYINESLGILCPSCGITRASIALLNFNLGLAISRNAYFTLILFPIFMILFIDDIICMIIKKKSLVEIILRTIRRKSMGGYIIIAISYILSIYLFYNLMRIRIKKEENRLNKVYVLIVLIILLIFVWNIFRM